MKAKLIKGEISYFQQPAHILGDASQYAKEQGYKEVIYREGDKGTWQDDEFIYIETPAPAPQTNDDIRMQREAAYKMESDSLYMAWQKYLAKGDTRAETAKKTWITKVIEIENRYKYLV
jgi:hypothetical protein